MKRCDVALRCIALTCFALLGLAFALLCFARPSGAHRPGPGNNNVMRCLVLLTLDVGPCEYQEEVYIHIYIYIYIYKYIFTQRYTYICYIYAKKSGFWGLEGEGKRCHM